MGKTRVAKDRSSKRNVKKRKLALNLKKKKTPTAAVKPESPPQEDQDPILFSNPNLKPDSDSESDSPPSPDSLQRLLEPHTKDQLISFLIDAISLDFSLLPNIKTLASRDVSHRKLFIHGLAWDASRDHLLQTFTSFGPVDDCNVVVDKSTGRAKGYGFVVFKTRAGAVKALREPQKRIRNRVVTCQLASLGSPSLPASGDSSGRKIHVSNVHPDASPDRLRALFAKFGDLEAGPIGFDVHTGRSRGFALFVYRTHEGAKRALEEPYKIFDGYQLHCQLAFDSTQKAKAAAAKANASTPASGAPSLMPAGPAAMQQPVLAAMAAAQNLALLGQTPAYGAMLAQNPLLAAAALNQAAGLLNPVALAALNPAFSHGLGGIPGFVGGAQPFLGLHRSQGATQVALQGGHGLQHLQGMQQLGHSADGNQSGVMGGYPSYVCWETALFPPKRFEAEATPWVLPVAHG